MKHRIAGSTIAAPEPADDYVALYKRTFRRVWGILGLVGVRRPDEREEVAQEVYLLVHQKLPARDADADEGAWVGAIAWRLGQRYAALRRTREEQPMNEPDIDDQVAAPQPTADEALYVRLAYDQIMGSVEPERRIVFEMHEVEGYSLPEIARALGVALGTVTTRLRLAREDVDAAVSRMRAHEARAGVPAALLVPFGAGGWASIGDLFDDAPPGAQERVWSGVVRGLVRAAASAGLGAASGALGTVTSGALFGSGAVLGGAVVASVLFALGVAGPSATPPPIARAPDTISLAPTAATPSEPPAGAASAGTPEGEAPAGALAQRTAAPSGATNGAGPVPPGSSIDPEEERIVARAYAAFARGNFDAARAALADHARRFPPGRGKLGAESDNLRAKLNAVAAPDAGTHRLFGAD